MRVMENKPDDEGSWKWTVGWLLFWTGLVAVVGFAVNRLVEAHPQWVRRQFDMLLTPESLPKIVHDGILLSITVIVLVLFRSQIAILLIKLTHLKIFGVELGSKEEGKLVLPRDASKDQKEAYQKFHCFWCGNDIMESHYQASRGDIERSRSALEKAAEHFKQSGLQNDEISKGFEKALFIESDRLMMEFAVMQKKRVGALLKSQAGAI